MNKPMRLIRNLAVSIVVLTIIAYVIFYFTGFSFTPKYFLGIPVFFLLLTLVLMLFVRKYQKENKELSVGSILAIRTILIAVIVVVLVINMLIDKEHILPLTIAFVVYDIIFSVFETKILLTLNKKN